jgi:O-acetyl-ADP-ribose deacetylase
MIEKIKGDITKIEADVIINAANTGLMHGGGVARAIAEAAGDILNEESRKIGFVPLGEFTLTSAGALKAIKVLHIPTVDYRARTVITYDQLRFVLRKAFSLCDKMGWYKIATPLLGAGAAALDYVRVEKIIVDESMNYPTLSVKIVTLN